MSTTAEPLRLALVGLGRIAQAHWEALKDREDIVLVGGVDPASGAAESWQAVGLNTYLETTTLVEWSAPAAAIVCTPPDTHRDVIKALLCSRVHVLAEKPLARTVADAQFLVDKARERGRVLQTASKFGVMPSLHRAAALVREGAIGKLLRVENLFSGALDVRDDWRAQPKRSGGGVWMDNGPHALDVLSAIAGPPRQIRVTAFEKKQGTPVEDEIAVELAFDGGVEGAIRLTWNEGIRAPIARVVGSEGTIDVGWADLRVQRGGHEEVERGGYDKVGCFRAVHDRFLAAVASGGCPDERGVRTLEAVEAGYQSANNGGGWKPIGERQEAS